MQFSFRPFSDRLDDGLLLPVCDFLFRHRLVEEPQHLFPVVEGCQFFGGVHFAVQGPEIRPEVGKESHARHVSALRSVVKSCVSVVVAPVWIAPEGRNKKSLACREVLSIYDA